MAKAFDLRKQLKLHDKQLLRRLFCDLPEMATVPWDTLRPHQVEPIIAVWEELGETRRHYQVILQDVNELADSRGQKVLIDEIQWRSEERLPELRMLRSRADRALWVHLEIPEAFHQAAMFSRTESLRNGRMANRYNSVPKIPIVVTPPQIELLEKGISDYYWNKQLRGEFCRVHHYERLGDAMFFYAYLPDCPDKLLKFDEENNLTAREDSHAFNNVFVYHPSQGAVELIAEGGQKVQQELRKVFCRSILGIEVNDQEPLRPSYTLDHLLDPSFHFALDDSDGIASVLLRKARFEPTVSIHGLEYLEYKSTNDASNGKTRDMIHRMLDAYELDATQVTVTQASFQMRFMSDGEGKGKSMTFYVHCPNSCDLKDKTDELRVIGERCLERWGIRCD